MSLVLDYTGGVFAAKPTGGSLGTDPSTIGDANFADVSLLLHGDGTSGSTTITDSSSNSTSVTVVGNTQIDTTVKKFGTGSIEFDGTGDELTYTAPVLSGDFTYEAWVYPESQVQAFPICFAPVSDATVANRVALSYDTSTYVDKFSCRVGSNFIVASSTSSTGQWYHLAIVRSGSTVSMYIDGVSQGTQTFSTSISSRTAYIGGSSLIGSNTHFAGFIDDFRFTNGLARYTSTFTAPTAAFSNTGPTLDLSSGNTFVHAPSANVAYAFSNPPASGTAIDFTLKVTPSATVTITWPSSVKWAGGTAPSAPASGETDAFTFYSTDGGSTYYGFHAGDAYS